MGFRDLQERAAQVSLMCRIYSVARTVIARLGGEIEASQDAYNIMNILADILTK
jgi:Flp pilus assembly secretin CpaC